MEKNQILVKLQEIFCDVFDNDDIELTLATVAEDIDEWDSLAHVQLIKEIESVFNIKLTSKEVLGWDNVGEMVSSIHSKLQ